VGEYVAAFLLEVLHESEGLFLFIGAAQSLDLCRRLSFENPSFNDEGFLFLKTGLCVNL
jgi:hypothetical protein